MRENQRTSLSVFQVEELVRMQSPNVSCSSELGKCGWVYDRISGGVRKADESVVHEICSYSRMSFISLCHIDASVGWYLNVCGVDVSIMLGDFFTSQS